MVQMVETFASFVGNGLWSVLKAVLILVLAFIVAAIVKSLVVKLLTKTKLASLLGKMNAGGAKATESIGKIVYLLVFLLFVPGIFECLGMNNISMPILNLLNTMWGYLPNILAAAIVLWVGFFIAKIVREILAPIFGKLKVDQLQKIAGIEAADTAKLSNTLAYIVYVLILIPVVITALQVLDISAISNPAIAMLDIIFGFIPNIFVALVLIIVGCMVAKLSGNIVENLIASAGLDKKLTALLDEKNKNFVLSKVAGRTVQAVMVIFFIVESFGVLHLQVLTDIGSTIIGYMPYVLAAALILVICFIGNAIVQKALAKNGQTTYALVIKCGIYALGGFMVLNQLGIAPEIVNTAFILIIAAVAVAFALAFGLGGKDFAGKALKKLEDKQDEEQKEEK